MQISVLLLRAVFILKKKSPFISSIMKNQNQLDIKKGRSRKNTDATIFYEGMNNPMKHCKQHNQKITQKIKQYKTFDL